MTHFHSDVLLIEVMNDSASPQQHSLCQRCCEL
jgi:hypothetical protein